MNKFKLGCNLDESLIPLVVELNDKYKEKGIVNEFYGSTRNYSSTAARPGFRLPDVQDKDFEKFCKKALDAGIIFNWTMNSIQPYGSKAEIINHKQEIHDTVKWLEDCGVYRITIANPMLGLVIREKSDIPFELSTISHLDAVTQIKMYKDTLGIDKLCMNVLHNRDWNFLDKCAKACKENDVILDLMATEFCYNTSGNSSTHCIFRDSCYLCHATNETKEEAMSFNNYPMGYCMASRGNSEAGWLRSRYILPQWLDSYNELGINDFKLTTRTAGNDYTKKIAEAYLSGNYTDDLISLWKPLESIYNGKEEAEVSKKFMNIPVPKMVENNFLKHWKDDKFLCHEHMCGCGKEVDPTYNDSDMIWHGDYACNYCQKFYEKYIK